MAGAHAVQSGPTSQVSGSTRSRSRRSSWPTSSREHGSRATARSSARAVQRQGGGGGVAIRPVLHSQTCAERGVVLTLRGNEPKGSSIWRGAIYLAGSSSSAANRSVRGGSKRGSIGRPYSGLLQSTRARSSATEKILALGCVFPLALRAWHQHDCTTVWCKPPVMHRTTVSILYTGVTPCVPCRVSPCAGVI